MNWHVYIVLCSDDSLYTGITTHMERRLAQHGSGRGAKYFRGRQPYRLVYLESGHDRSSASRREAEIKGMTRAEKSELASSWGYALFTDVSVSPRRKWGVGGYIAIPIAMLDVPPDRMERTKVIERLVMRRLVDTSSTKLEVQTAVWALEDYDGKDACFPVSGNLRLYTDSQCVAGLRDRRVALEARTYLSKRTGQPLANAGLYRRFYELTDRLGCEVNKVAGHAHPLSQDTVHLVFSWLDREVRQELRRWCGELSGEGD